MTADGSHSACPGSLPRRILASNTGVAPATATGTATATAAGTGTATGMGTTTQRWSTTWP